MADSVLYESRPSIKVVFAWFIQSIFILIIFFFFLWISILSTSILSGGIFGVDFLWLAASLSMALLIYLFIQWKTYQYKVASDGIYFSGGVLIHRQKFIPFYKVTDLEVSQNILERLLGISSLGFQTAGAGARNKPEITFAGLVDAQGPMEITHKQLKQQKSD